MSTLTISTKELRNNLPDIRAGLSRGNQYTIIYRSKPIANLEPFVQEDVAVAKKLVGGSFRLQEKSKQRLTPEYLNKLSESKYE
jgi:antitoxin (DNA-binding transcriptional repressor) of toxin-antitoxin stability system